MCLSPYVETFNSKVIKSFRTWTNKSLRVFEFRDSYILYMFYRYEHYMSILHIALIVAMEHFYVIIAYSDLFYQFKNIKKTTLLVKVSIGRLYPNVYGVRPQPHEKSGYPGFIMFGAFLRRHFCNFPEDNSGRYL